MSHFIVTDRKTDYLLPPSLDDWLNEGNYSVAPAKGCVGQAKRG